MGYTWEQREAITELYSNMNMFGAVNSYDFNNLMDLFDCSMLEQTPIEENLFKDIKTCFRRLHKCN